jgi:hypothetical protein
MKTNPSCKTGHKTSTQHEQNRLDLVIWLGDRFNFVSTESGQQVKGRGATEKLSRKDQAEINN